MSTIGEALSSLRPEAEWYCLGDDYSGIVWQSDDNLMPSEDEVAAEIRRLDMEKRAKSETDVAARAAAIAHAKSLGFTDEMIAVMYPSLGAADV